jgi:excinuclease UvrABC nuclease subunit
MMNESEVRPFNSSNVSEVPDREGIYVIYDADAGDVQAYLGRSVDLKRRLKEHLSCGSNASKSVKMLVEMGHELWFSYSTSSNYKGAEAAELNRYMPAGNKRLERKYLEDF